METRKPTIETKNRISADNLLSNAISVVSNATSVLSQKVSVISNNLSVEIVERIAGDAVVFNAVSNETSARAAADILLSNAISTVSNNLSNEISNRTSADSVLQNAISVVSNALSVETAARIAADDILSNAISVVSNALSNEISNRISADNVLSNAISAVSNNLSNEISNRTSADNLLSNAISVVSNALSDLISVHNVLSNRVSANSATGGGASVTSAEHNVLSNRISLLVSAPTDIVSGNTITRRVMAAAATVSAAALTNVSGLSVSVDAGGVYKLESILMLTRGAAAAVGGYGLTFPAMTNARGMISVTLSTVPGAFPSISTQGRSQPWNEAASGSILISTVSTGNLITRLEIRGLVVPSAGGSIHPQVKAAAGASATIIQAGSYIEVVRIA